jgi:hypothetical protein
VKSAISIRVGSGMTKYMFFLLVLIKAHIAIDFFVGQPTQKAPLCYAPHST